jgi:hypothetical protein
MRTTINYRPPKSWPVADDAESERERFTIANLRTRRGSHGRSAHVPTRRDVQGIWKPVVTMPGEMPGPPHGGVTSQ